MKIKNIAALTLSLAFSLSLLTGCGSGNTTPANSTAAPAASVSSSASADTSAYANWPEQNINYIITASAGGGLDLCARILAPYWEEATGNKATVTVNNVTGGANWIGWTEMMTAEPNGYTVSNIHTPQCFSYLNKSLGSSATLDSFNLLCNYVTDSVTVVVRADDARFADINSLTDLVDYLKANSGTTFSVSLTSQGGADQIALLELMSQAGVTNLLAVNHSDGISAQKAAFLGGDCDLEFGKVGDTLSMYQEGSAKILAVCKAERSEYMPDVPTAIEQGYDIVCGSDRGIVCQPGMDEGLKAVIVDSLRTACSNPEFLADMKDGGYEVNWMEGDEYTQYMKDQEALIIKYADELGYNG